MADNVELDAGSGGATIATDDDGTAHHQYVKVEFGADNTQTKVTSSAGLPVTPDSGGFAVTNAGTFATQVDGAALTALQLIDDVVFTDDAAYTLGTSKGVMMMGFAGTQSVNANDAGAIAMETDGAIHIHDGGNTITVDGTVTANLGATDNAVLDSIDAAVNGTLTVGSHAVTNAGTFAVQVDGSALTALQLIDDIVHVDDTATHATGTTKGAAFMAAATPTDGSVDANDMGVVAMSTDRRLHTDAQIVGQDATLTVDGSAVTQPVSAASLPLPTGAATAANQSTANTALSAIQTATELIDNAISGSEMQVDVVAALPAGSNLVGDVGLSGARTSGGTTLYKNIDVDESEDQIKGTAGQVYWIHAVNLTASVLYLKFYNATAASVTVGSTVPDLTFPIPTQGDTNGAGFTLSIPNGIAFGTAITIAATTGVADADSGAPAANACVVNLGYA